MAAVVKIALIGGGLGVPPPVRAHEAVSVEEEFVKGVFSPAFTPPAAGSYELPAVKRVPGVILKDLTGRSASTRQVTAGKVAVVSFIYTACPERLGCPLASLALQDLQAKLKEEGLARDLVRGIQGMRKRCGFAVEDRVQLFYQGDGTIAGVLERWRDYIGRETLAQALERQEAPATACIETLTIDGQSLRVGLVKVGAGTS